MEDIGLNEWSKQMKWENGCCCVHYSRCFSWHRSARFPFSFSVYTTDENSFRVIRAYALSLLNKFRNIYMQIISTTEHFPSHIMCVYIYTRFAPFCLFLDFSNFCLFLFLAASIFLLNLQFLTFFLIIVFVVVVVVCFCAVAVHILFVKLRRQRLRQS